MYAINKHKIFFGSHCCSLQSMVKDMDSYIDGCIGKDDFFKLATVNHFWTNSASFAKLPLLGKNRTSSFSISRLGKWRCQLGRRRREKTKKEKRFDEKDTVDYLIKRMLGKFIRVLVKTRFETEEHLKGSNWKFETDESFQTYHALWPYYSVVFNTPKKSVEVRYKVADVKPTASIKIQGVFSRWASP